MDGGCGSGADIMVAPDWSICVTYGLRVFVCLVSPAGSCWSNGTRSWGVESLRARQVSGYFRAWSGRYCCQDCCHRPPHPAPARTAELSRSYVLRSRRVGRRDCVIIGA